MEYTKCHRRQLARDDDVPLEEFLRSFPNLRDFEAMAQEGFTQFGKDMKALRRNFFNPSRIQSILQKAKQTKSKGFRPVLPHLTTLPNATQTSMCLRLCGYLWYLFCACSDKSLGSSA